MRKIAFAKYEALGNDFLIVDQIIDEKTCVRMCERHIGVGADGVLAVLPSQDPIYVACMHITNADGSIPEMCGNGFRCVAMRLLHQEKIRINQSYSMLTDAGPRAFVVDEMNCTVEMGIPEFMEQSLELDSPAWGLSLGNPHLVVKYFPSIEEIKKRGPQLEKHEAFSKRTNVEFVRVISEREIDLVVWERGAGLTQACGTGACASVAALIRNGDLVFDAYIQVNLPGGSLEIMQQRESGMIKMRGPANKVFDGVIDTSDLCY